MVHTEPALAIMIISVVAVVFLAPVLAIALILLYRMRKTRMQNETMLKLAEEGDRAAGGHRRHRDRKPAVTGRFRRRGADGCGSAATMQVRAIRKQAAWSDLRKGVVMGAIGLGVTLYSLFEDRSANGIGLVLLFLGIGYVVLWWFEERQWRRWQRRRRAPGQRSRGAHRDRDQRRAPAQAAIAALRWRNRP